MYLTQRAESFALSSIFTVVLLLSPALAHDAGQVHTHPASPPPGATLPVGLDAPRIASTWPQDGSDPETIKIRPLDDPANPYREHYTPYDRWFYDYYAPEARDEEKAAFGMNRAWNFPEHEALQLQYPENWTVQLGFVDEQGNLVPYLHEDYGGRGNTFERGDTLREKLAWRQARGEPKKRFYFWTAGVFPPESLVWANERAADQRAHEYPTIPAWLGENPPLQAVFVPNGDVLTYGPLGLVIESDGSRTSHRFMQPEGETWYRYTADGRLIETRDIRDGYGIPNWQELYHDWDAVQAELEQQHPGKQLNSRSFANGYRIYAVLEETSELRGQRVWMVPEDGTAEIVAAYIYDGKPVDPDEKLPPGGQWIGMQLDRDMIVKMFAAQVRLGLTDPGAVSPFAGTPEGPVAVDSTPRPAKFFARSYAGRGGDVRKIEVRPLDDPANPYRGQYGPWDVWIYEQRGKSNPRSEVFYREQSKLRTAEMTAARKEGREPDPELMGHNPFIQEVDDPWQHFQMEVDENGFMVPKLVTELNSSSLRTRRDLREPFVQQTERPATFGAGGVMPAELEAAYEAARKATLPSWQPELAELPRWLRDSPPLTFLLIPNGDIVTWGPLGQWKRDWRKIPKEERDFETGWHRYNAQGELVGKVAERADFAKLYNHQYDALKLSGEAQGYRVESPSGYLLWRPDDGSFGGEALAAWDYDGTPVSLDQPLNRDGFYFRPYDWDNFGLTAEEQEQRTAELLQEAREQARSR